MARYHPKSFVHQTDATEPVVNGAECLDSTYRHRTKHAKERAI